MRNPVDSWTIKLPRQLSARVARLARKRGISRSALVREAVEKLANEGGEETFVDRVAAFVGAAKGLPADLSTNPKYLRGYGK